MKKQLGLIEAGWVMTISLVLSQAVSYQTLDRRQNYPTSRQYHQPTLSDRTQHRRHVRLLCFCDALTAGRGHLQQRAIASTADT
jgi:hypothetical protein